jgi:hypothetical protein
MRAGTVAVLDAKRFQKSKRLRRLGLTYQTRTAYRRRQFLFLLKTETQSSRTEAQKFKQ